MRNGEVRGGAPEVLVVDDERFMRATLRAALEENGFAVREAESGAAAIQAVHQAPPDLVLLDIVMPGLDGFATCAALRRMPEGRHLPVLMVTALEDAATIDRSYAAGATDYITKPINPSYLRHHLRYVLRSDRLFGELRLKEQRLAEAQRIAGLGNWEWDPRTGELLCSQEARRLLGLPPGEEKADLALLLDRVHPEERRAVEAALAGARQGGGGFDLDHRIIRPDGAVRLVHAQGELVPAPRGKGARLAGTLQDITERRQVQEKLLLAGKVFDHSSEMILIAGADARIVDVNPAFCRLTGYGREEAVGRSLRVKESPHHDEHFFRSLWQTLEQTGHWQGEMWNRRRDGESFPALLSINAVRDGGGRLSHYVATATDISRLRQTELRLKHLAQFDPLTDLPNRLLFHDRLQQALIQAARGTGVVAVLVLDLDDFREVNETLGHQAGDQALRLVARRLSGRVRRSDTVARLGSDEFAVVLREMNRDESSLLVAQRILDTLARPFRLDGREFFLEASIGIALYPEDGEDAEQLAKNAETALHYAKQQGKNRCQFFSEKMNRHTRERLALKTDLRHALEREEFFLHYQPKFDSVSGRLTGLEALARWQHPERGLVPPLQFIPLAEETGLIVPLGERVLRLACAQNRAWRERGFPAFRVAVNLSAVEFRDGALPDTVRRVLAETGLAADGLELEITESAIMQDAARAVETLRQFKEMGIRIALDDFGTGYSSLSYLRRFPVDALKIDYSFVRNIFVNAEDAAIVRAIIAMAHSLKLKVIAEGVETEEQRVFLREQGCDEVQGYLAGMPQPAAEVERFLGRP